MPFFKLIYKSFFLWDWFVFRQG